jgi:hypothetical protein
MKTIRLHCNYQRKEKAGPRITKTISRKLKTSESEDSGIDEAKEDSRDPVVLQPPAKRNLRSRKT